MLWFKLCGSSLSTESFSSTGQKSKQVSFYFLYSFSLLHFTPWQNVLMREKQLSETRWGVKIYFPHFPCVKTLSLISFNPSVAFTQQDSVAFKATLRDGHAGFTRGCRQLWRGVCFFVFGNWREQKRIGTAEIHTQTGFICTATASKPAFMISSIRRVWLVHSRAARYEEGMR